MRTSCKPNPRKKHVHLRLDYLLCDLLDQEVKETGVAKSNIIASILLERYGKKDNGDYCIRTTKTEDRKINNINEKIEEHKGDIQELKQERMRLLK